MKKIQQVTWVLITAISIFMSSCGPNDDKGSLDQDSNKEGAVDSSKMPGLDSSHTSQ